MLNKLKSKVSRKVLQGLQAVCKKHPLKVYNGKTVRTSASSMGFNDTSRWIAANRWNYFNGVMNGFYTDEPEVQSLQNSVVYPCVDNTEEKTESVFDGIFTDTDYANFVANNYDNVVFDVPFCDDTVDSDFVAQNQFAVNPIDDQVIPDDQPVMNDETPAVYADCVPQEYSSMESVTFNYARVQDSYVPQDIPSQDVSQDMPSYDPPTYSAPDPLSSSSDYSSSDTSDYSSSSSSDSSSSSSDF